MPSCGVADEKNAIKRAVSLLSPDAPARTLATLARGPKATARCWFNGRRRPPVAIAEQLLDILKERHAAIFEAIHILQRDIDARRNEPPSMRRRGCCALDYTGRRGRRRL